MQSKQFTSINYALYWCKRFNSRARPFLWFIWEGNP